MGSRTKRVSAHFLETNLSLSSNPIPLVIDLDGTLIRTDMLHESVLRLLRDKPLSTLLIPFWVMSGKAELKRNLSARTAFDAGSLPYNEEFLTWLTEERANGRRLVLCSASDQSIVDAIAAHVGLFDVAIGSDGKTNLAGEQKAQALAQRYGKAGFDYAGNSSADVPVWQSARHAVVVNASPAVAQAAHATSKVERIFEQPARDLSVWRRMLRVHQWLKNLLLFVPLAAAHQIANPNAWASLAFAFIAFSLCASAVYIANDLLDLESDRAHPRKRTRPFASGMAPIWWGAALAPMLLAASALAALFVNVPFQRWLLGYFALTCAYSWGLKRFVLVDCLVLAVLYTLRIFAGAAAVAMPLSFWLLAFSVFLFLSLAFVKRYAELQVQIIGGHEKLHGRGYFTSDAPLIQILGVAAGFSAALVLALYLNSDAVVQLYKAPQLVWGAVPILLFWVSWMWMQAHRGVMHDDPLVFAVKDKASVMAGAVFTAVIAAGAVGWRW